MFDWLRRRIGAPAADARKPSARTPAQAPKPARRDAARHAASFADTAPLPEVIAEGNTQADWSAWEDSMTALDSQMQELVPSSRIYVRDTRPTQLDELDAFASVKGKRDL